MAQIFRLTDDWQMPGLLARLDTAHDTAVVLVLPTRGHGWANPARLRLIRRCAARRQLRIALVTGDPTVRHLASEAGLPVYYTTREAAQVERLAPPSPDGSLPEDPQADVRARLTSWRVQRVRERAQTIAHAPWRRSPAWVQMIGLMMLLATLASVVLLAMALLVPVAYVTLVPSRQTVAVTVDLTAATGVDYPDSTQKLVPARWVEVQIEGNGTLPTTGRRDAPDQRAVGTVIFVNRQVASQEIPAGTIVRTSTGTNVRFRTTAAGTLGAGIGATIALPIEAVDPGPAGNVRSGTITLVDGPLARTVRVINEQPTVSGTVRQVSVVTNADKDRLRQAVLQQVRQTAYQRLSEMVNEGELLPPESIAIMVLEETFDHFVDEPAETLGLRLRVLARGMAIDNAAGQQIAFQVMQAQVPERARLLTDRIRYQQGPVTIQEGRATFSLTATGEMISDIDRAAVRAAIAGLPLDEARAVLANEWSLAAPPELRLEPDWIGRVPWVPFRIRVQSVLWPDRQDRLSDRQG